MAYQKFRNAHPSPDIISVVKSVRMRWGMLRGNTRSTNRRDEFYILGKPERKWSLWRPRRTYEDNIKEELHQEFILGKWKFSSTHS